MKKIILTFAIPSIIMTSAHAATLFQTSNGSNLNLYGHVRADLTDAGHGTKGTAVGNSKQGDLTTTALLGIQGQKHVNNDVTLFTKGEWQVAGQSSDGNKFFPRKVYVGADFGKGGTLTIGQHHDLIYTSLIHAVDIFDEWGKGTMKGIYGKTFQPSQVVYSNNIGNLDIMTSYQFRNSDGLDKGGIDLFAPSTTPETVQDNAYAIAAIYHTNLGLNLHAAYARQNYGYSSFAKNSDGKIDTYGAGADYNLNALYMSFIYIGSKTNTGEASKNLLYINTYNLVASYQIDQYKLYTGYGIQHRNGSEISSIGYTPIKSYKLGVQYFVTPLTKVWLEYRHNNGDLKPEDNFDDSTLGYAKNEIALTGQYNF
ncbi:porin [Marinomonas sp. TI.3.20]|uniref:porin n=1 Tax=Marinomonas sp. TI.3.20 TaxID=3121296 RepID=UPI0031200902